MGEEWERVTLQDDTEDSAQSETQVSQERRESETTQDEPEKWETVTLASGEIVQTIPHGSYVKYTFKGREFKGSIEGFDERDDQYAIGNHCVDRENATLIELPPVLPEKHKFTTGDAVQVLSSSSQQWKAAKIFGIRRVHNPEASLPFGSIGILYDDESGM